MGGKATMLFLMASIRKEKVVFCGLLKFAFSEGIRIGKVVGYKYYHNELH